MNEKTNRSAGHELPDAENSSESVAAQAMGKAINDVDFIVQRLLSAIPSAKPWQRQLLSQLHVASRHLLILRLVISLDKDDEEIRAAARALLRVLEVINDTTARGRADSSIRKALWFAQRSASLLNALIAH